MMGAHGWVLAAALVAAGGQASPAGAPKPGYKYELELSPDRRNAMAAAKRDEAIEQLKNLLPRFTDQNPAKPDLLFQLSDFYWEKYKYLYSAEEKQYEADYAKFQAAVSERPKGEPKRNHTESDRYRAETIKLYTDILTRFPSYPRTDEVLFSIAYTLSELGQGSLATTRYQELVSRFPKSQYVGDAYIQLGDYWFEHNSLPKAQSNYQQAYRFDSPRIQAYALYKLAWCDYNVGELEQSLKKLHQVIDFKGGDGKDLVLLRNEALNDCVIVYTQLDRPDAAIAFVESRTTGDRRGKLLSKLAAALADAGHHEGAIHTFRHLIEQNPNRPDAPDFQQSIVRGYEKLFERKQVRIEVKRLAELYRPGSSWWQANEGHPNVLRDAFAVAEEGMRAVVTDYHREAQATKQVETYRLARDIYKEYVDTFASSKDPKYVSDAAFNMRFYYAEMLWTLEDWDAAAQQYDAVVSFQIPAREEAKQISNEKYRKTAAYNAILAYDKLLKVERGELRQTNLADNEKIEDNKGKGAVQAGSRISKLSAKDFQQKPLTRSEQRLAKACDTYVLLFPGEKDEIDVRYQAAVLYYDRSHFVEAARRFSDIILKWPEEKRSEEAADLTLFLLDAQKQWYDLSMMSRQFLANKKLCKPGTEFTQRVATVAEGSRYKWIDEVIYRKEKNPRRAAEEFLKFAQEYPRAEAADRAVAYAVLMFEEAAELDRGLSAGQRMLNEYPGSVLELKVRYTLARLLEKTADFGGAAQMYQSFVEAYDHHAEAVKVAQGRANEGKARTVKAITGVDVDAKDRVDADKRLVEEASAWLADAQFNAAIWYEAAGQVDRAVASYRQYMLRFKARNDVPEMLLAIGRLYEKQQRWVDATRAYHEFTVTFANDPRVSPAKRYEAKALEAHAARSGRGPYSVAMNQDAIRGYSRLPADVQGRPEVKAAYARERFAALEPLWEIFTAIKLSRVNNLKTDLLAKQRKLEQLESAYVEVLSIGVGEYGIAALTRVGMAYGDLASAIRNSPVPRGLDADQAQLYQTQLEALATPLEEKAVDAAEKALAKASELSIYSQWTLTAQGLVNRYQPNSYPEVRAVDLQHAELFVDAPLQTHPAEQSVADSSKPRDWKARGWAQ